MPNEVEIVWEAPPPVRPRTMYDEALREVRERRGQWARLRTFGNNTSAYSARSSLKRVFGNDEAWESAVRPLDDEQTSFGLYVRYRTAEQLRQKAV